MTIALVDDDQFVLFIHSKLLQNFDNTLNIVTYTCPEEFVQVLEDDSIDAPDFIFSDYKMGIINGVELLKRVERVKKNNSKYNGKLNFYLVSSELNIESIFNNCTSDILKGYHEKPLSPHIISTIFNNSKIAS